MVFLTVRFTGGNEDEIALPRVRLTEPLCVSKTPLHRCQDLASRRPHITLGQLERAPATQRFSCRDAGLKSPDLLGVWAVDGVPEIPVQLEAQRELRGHPENQAKRRAVSEVVVVMLGHEEVQELSA